MLLALSGAESQEGLSAWLLSEHHCEVSQGTNSNWLNGRVERIAPEKHYVLADYFSTHPVEPADIDPAVEAIIRNDLHTDQAVTDHAAAPEHAWFTRALGA